MQNRYPLWKNLLLGLILIIGLIYAAPNLFVEDPAIQISSKAERGVIDEKIFKEVGEILQNADIPFKAISREKDQILVRFFEIDFQLEAQDKLEKLLGKDFIIALNLASRTPQWLTAFGANPMKMGLDLRGGVHFLLEVDVNELLKAHADGDIHALGDELRTNSIRYAAIRRKKPHGLIIHFRDRDNLERAFVKISRHFPDYLLSRKVDADNFVLEAILSESAIFKISDYAIDQTITILRNRVDELGVSEAIVQRQGQNYVSVDLPGIQDTTRAKDIIGKTATLKFQMVDVDHDLASAVAGDVPLGSRLYEYEGRPILLKEQVILQGKAITYATASYAQDGRPSVEVRLGGGGESLFNRVTRENIGKPMAVVYVETKLREKVIDGEVVKEPQQVKKVISVATIQSALGMNFQITGLRSQKYASDLALLLRSGALVAPVNIIEELTVGPSAGKANIQKGLISVLAGFTFVVLFIVFYYRLFGLVADIALLLNLVFVVALLSILGATLTLPGIAGIVLTVGMAVDANVLIYERIREELRNGITPQASIYSGYARALVTIVDANVTTLIVAIVLLALGSGAVKGFAVTLTLGLLTSMMTSIVFTRAIVNLIYGWRNVKNLSIGCRKKSIN